MKVRKETGILMCFHVKKTKDSGMEFRIMSQLKGNLCDFCQSPIGHIEFAEDFNYQSDFLLKKQNG